jgi:hypothetical protein
MDVERIRAGRWPSRRRGFAFRDERPSLDQYS